MARKFEIPAFYRSPIISALKEAHGGAAPSKETPSVLDLGRIRFKVARHFGFCFGVENAIEIAYRALHENPYKRVFLLSEMIHNPHVNGDLVSRGVRFLLAPDGTQLIPFSELNPEDVVIVPAFGTTIELLDELEKIGIDPSLYNSTCPFVEKVWKRAQQLGDGGYTVVIHGKHYHEETKATFSHARMSSPSVIIRDISEAQLLAAYIKHEIDFSNFESDFRGSYSDNFIASKHLKRIGVVNQTTMLATETQEISDLLQNAMEHYYGNDNLSYHYADTRDTLCYATNENQAATYGLIKSGGDLALVVGGYNSSNTSHLVALCKDHVPTYYIKDADELLSKSLIRHLDQEEGEVKETKDWLDIDKDPLEILVTAGASCPDVFVEQVLRKISSFFALEQALEAAVDGMQAS